MGIYITMIGRNKRLLLFTNPYFANAFYPHHKSLPA